MLIIGYCFSPRVPCIQRTIRDLFLADFLEIEALFIIFLGHSSQVGSTVYGRVYPYPTNTKEAIMAEVESPTDLWMSIKQLEPPKTPGLVLKEREKFWELARKMQEEESGQVGVGTLPAILHFNMNYLIAPKNKKNGQSDTPVPPVV